MKRLHSEIITYSAATPVMISESGMKKMMPSSPQNSGSSSGSPTPHTISRSMDSAVDTPPLAHGLQENKCALIDTG